MRDLGILCQLQKCGTLCNLSLRLQRELGGVVFYRLGCYTYWDSKERDDPRRWGRYSELITKSPVQPVDSAGEASKSIAILHQLRPTSFAALVDLWLFADINMAMLKTDNIAITPEILALIAQIEEFKGAWRALGTLAPERLLALRRIATIESVASSTRIEGSQMTNAEVNALLSNLKVKKFTTRDEQEVAGYAEVMELLFASWEHIPFNENHIQQLHRDLLTYSSKDGHHRGRYKTISNNVGAFNAQGEQVAVVFETAKPFDTPRLMQELVDWVRYAKDNQSLHPLLIVAVFVVVFLEIHPFEDGNGRLSRILTTLLMLQFGYAYVPYSSLESIIEQNKQGYYIALRQTQGTIRTDNPNWQPWLQFFLASLCSQVKRLGEKVEREKFQSQRVSQLSADLIALARENGRLTTAQAEQQTRAKRPTIKAHLVKLVKDGHLIQHGVGRGTWYTVSEP